MGIELDATFWALIALLIFGGVLVYFGVPGQITKALDSRAKKISDELDSARELREKAQELLAQYQRKRRDAEQEAADIVEQARRDAERLVEQTRAKLSEQLERRTRQAEEKIARAEEQAAAEVRNVAIDVSVAAARDVIGKSLAPETRDKLITDSIAAVKTDAAH